MLFEQQIFDYFILDEAQGIKNPHSDTTKLCFEIRANRFLTLTGTPLENSVSDLWSQVHFFNRNMLGSLRNFEKNCKHDDKMKLYRLLLKPFLLRRLKTEVLNDLPEKQIVVQYCDMTEEQALFYKALRNGYINKFIESKSNDSQLSSITVLEGLLRMRQASNHPMLVDRTYDADSGKMQMVMQKLHEVLAQGGKILIFSSFVEHLKIYRQQLDAQAIAYTYLDGSTKDRQEQVQRFQTDDSISVFLLSLKSGGVGLNLTKADYVFLLDPWWNPAAEAQELKTSYSPKGAGGLLLGRAPYGSGFRHGIHKATTPKASA
jgi:SNF2 family DNA or RNA helicase